MTTTLEWIAGAINPTGGIAAWKDTSGTKHRSYPEVAGYLIPTLFDWGCDDLACGFANWLLKVQNGDGSFDGLDEVPRTFDTSACWEGLERAYIETHEDSYIIAAKKARGWLKTQVRPDGTLKREPRYDDTHLYTMRASWLIGSKAGAKHWTPKGAWDERWGEKQRTHYLAYMLEGLWRMGVYDEVETALEASQTAFLPGGLMPMYVRKNWLPDGGTDGCATAQFAMLYSWAGIDPWRLMEGAEKFRQPSGGIWQSLDDHREISWGAKYYLDALKAYSG